MVVCPPDVCATPEPTGTPTLNPTDSPTTPPTDFPTGEASDEPTLNPTSTTQPSPLPSPFPTSFPTLSPSGMPSKVPDRPCPPGHVGNYPLPGCESFYWCDNGIDYGHEAQKCVAGFLFDYNAGRCLEPDKVDCPFPLDDDGDKEDPTGAPTAGPTAVPTASPTEVPIDTPVNAPTTSSQPYCINDSLVQDTGCTNGDLKVCVNLDGTQPPNGSAGQACVVCVNHRENPDGDRRDAGCTNAAPICVNLDGSDPALGKPGAQCVSATGNDAPTVSPVAEVDTDSPTDSPTDFPTDAPNSTPVAQPTGRCCPAGRTVTMPLPGCQTVYTCENGVDTGNAIDCPPNFLFDMDINSCIPAAQVICPTDPCAVVMDGSGCARRLSLFRQSGKGGDC